MFKKSNVAGVEASENRVLGRILSRAPGEWWQWYEPANRLLEGRRQLHTKERPADDPPRN